MNTQNVNVKTAAQEPSERYGEKNTSQRWSEKYPDAERIMIRQLKIMEELHGMYSSPDELAQSLYEIFNTLTDRVVFNGVDNSPSDKPKIAYAVAQYWIKAQRRAAEYFGETGVVAWEHARYRLHLQLAINHSYH
ncbi:dehydrogenase [Serratia odorifera]|uniref:dehydrogenase n=1 Tax=Serratia odorifera TaxID=618 RepID=UPI003531B7A4